MSKTYERTCIILNSHLKKSVMAITEPFFINNILFHVLDARVCLSQAVCYCADTQGYTRLYEALKI